MNHIKMTKDEYTESREDDGGRCLACGAEAYGVEPDAREYQCDACGENQVYGIEELLIMGAVELV